MGIEPTTNPDYVGAALSTLYQKLMAKKRGAIPTKRRVAEVAEEIAEGCYDSFSANLSADLVSQRFVRNQNDAGAVKKRHGPRLSYRYL